MLRLSELLFRYAPVLITALMLCLYFAVSVDGLWLQASVGFALVVFAVLLFHYLADDDDVQDPAAQNHLEKQKTIADTLQILHAVLEASPLPAVIVDVKENVLQHNRAASKMLEGLKNTAPFSFALRAPQISDAMELVFKSGVPAVVDYQEHIPLERRVSAMIAPLRLLGQSQSIDALLVTLKDLTEQHQLERMRVDFVANASHELKTPLASVLGFIDTLQGPAKNDEAAREKFLKIMQEQAKRMSRLVDDLLSLSRIELHAHIPPSDPVDLSELISSTIDALVPLAKERKVSIEWAKPKACIVLGTRDELFRLFENLIENAIKYGESGKRVIVALDLHQQHAQVQVQDFGAGIPEDHLPRLTERFYRVDAASSREKGGTGLGLAIVKHIISHHRGELQIDSKVGEGSVFKVILPLAPQG